ncbi:hypothetical protein Daus18300_008460 [Diaporthe australafricana]|uniref:HNH nuclease domain-containing protein n=1 Tax=Diaporthe australafricana TaxID=127596 RepID=A0ABR3WII2_9PEZI
MSMTAPQRWTPRGLMAKLVPHLFRKPRSANESVGPRSEKVPVDANVLHNFRLKKVKKMKKAMEVSFLLRGSKPLDTPRGTVWSVATGDFVPESSLRLEHIFPASLGPTVQEYISPRINIYSAFNGLLLPHAVGQAFNDVSKTPILGFFPNSPRGEDEDEAEQPKLKLFKLLLKTYRQLFPGHNF